MSRLGVAILCKLLMPTYAFYFVLSGDVTLAIALKDISMKQKTMVPGNTTLHHVTGD